MVMYGPGRRGCEHANNPDACNYNHDVTTEQLTWVISNRNVHPDVVYEMIRNFNAHAPAGVAQLTYVPDHVKPGLGPFLAPTPQPGEVNETRFPKVQPGPSVDPRLRSRPPPSADNASTTPINPPKGKVVMGASAWLGDPVALQQKLRYGDYMAAASAPVPTHRPELKETFGGGKETVHASIPRPASEISDEKEKKVALLRRLERETTQADSSEDKE
ncbi:hypothetical protein C7974DRAFT_94674 [Boeremia exigua]|uniref:uncharacterized protein n=1 Tax=Boeremia exigua TaxID=749465 RepID=UPI001E8DC2EA|nr:uncharacterized protein C7974DRAFT_94674 [Boeremia exigua]KAH6642068.1 hypothetical protein C7974DRAFT_94674 [Boeremia exigua]